MTTITTPSNPATEAPLQAGGLLPCDWCGEVPTGYEHRDVTGEGYYAVECRSKKCYQAGRFCGVHGDDVAEVHRAWNERHTPPPQEAPAPVRAVDAPGIPNWFPDDCCQVCGWTLAASREQGCVEGDCSYRPREGTEEYARIKRRRDALAIRKQPDTRRVASGEDRDLERAIEQRDDREEVIDEILDLVLGTNRREWSSMYDYADAIEDVKEALSASPTRAQAASAGEPVAATVQDDGPFNVVCLHIGADDYPLRGGFAERPNAERFAARLNAAFAAPTDGRYPNDGAYREVTLDDVRGAIDAWRQQHGTGIDSINAALNYLRSIHAVIRIQAGAGETRQQAQPE